MSLPLNFTIPFDCVTKLAKNIFILVRYFNQVILYLFVVDNKKKGPEGKDQKLST
jgi:hypothetical protein